MTRKNPFKYYDRLGKRHQQMAKDILLAIFNRVSGAVTVDRLLGYFKKARVSASRDDMKAVLKSLKRDELAYSILIEKVGDYHVTSKGLKFLEDVGMLEESNIARNLMISVSRRMGHPLDDSGRIPTIEGTFEHNKDILMRIAMESTKEYLLIYGTEKQIEITFSDTFIKENTTVIEG